jgi:hypothetical protein
VRLQAVCAVLLVGAGTAMAWTGIAGDGGPVLTQEPDLIQASVLDSAAGEVQACFDQTAPALAADAFTITGYDSAFTARSTAVAPDPDLSAGPEGNAQNQCVRVTFPVAADVGRRTQVSVAAAPDHPEESVSLEGSAVDASQRGLTDGPDLVGIRHDDANGEVIYQFDEPIAGVTGAGAFRVIEVQGTTRAAAGTLVVSPDRLCVTAQFAPDNDVAGASTAAGAVSDAAGNTSPVGSVGLGITSRPPPDPRPECDATTPTATPTTTPAATPTTTPTATPTASPYKRITKAKIRARRHRRRITGRLIAPSPCAGRRTVTFVRHGHGVGATTTGPHGAFRIRLKTKRSVRVVIRSTRRAGVYCVRVTAARRL